MDNAATPIWPDLPYATWRETAATLQLWTQIVGKVRLTLTPWLNHGWHVPLYVTARGLGTSPIPDRHRDPRDRVRFRRPPSRRPHQPTARSGRCRCEPQIGRRFLPPRARSARRPRRRRRINDDAERGADPIPLRAGPASTPPTTPRGAPLLARAACRSTACSRCSAPVSSARRARCISSGAASTSPSPASRAAPRRSIPAACPSLPDCGDARGLFARGQQRRLLARQRRVPAGRLLLLRLSRAAGLSRPAGAPPGARFDPTLGEFILPYDTVRTAADPDALLLDFLSTTYAAAADAGRWDRAALECPIGVPARVRRV